jgi:predicted amidohydrolase YtcJ
MGGWVDSGDTVGYTMYTSRPDATTLQVILTGDLSPGNVAQLHIVDERLASQYSASVSQVAARATYIERDPAAYRLDLKP